MKNCAATTPSSAHRRLDYVLRVAVLRQFEMMGVYPLNESVAIGPFARKLRSLQLLARDGIGLPVTTFAHDPKQTDEVLKLSGAAPVVVKLLEGTQGIGVVLADTDRSAKSVVERSAAPASIYSCRNSSRRPVARISGR